MVRTVVRFVSVPKAANTDADFGIEKVKS